MKLRPVKVLIRRLHSNRNTSVTDADADQSHVTTASHENPYLCGIHHAMSLVYLER